MNTYPGGSSNRLRHIASDSVISADHHAVSSFSDEDSVTLPTSFGAAVLTHVPASLSAAQRTYVQDHEDPATKNAYSAYPSSPNAAAGSPYESSSNNPAVPSSVESEGSTKFNSNTNLLSHPPPLIRHAETSDGFQQQDLEQSSLETTIYTKLCHDPPGIISPPPPPDLIPIQPPPPIQTPQYNIVQFKAEPEVTPTLWHTTLPTPGLNHVPWPIPPNARKLVGAGGEGNPALAVTSGVFPPPSLMMPPPSTYTQSAAGNGEKKTL